MSRRGKVVLITGMLITFVAMTVGVSAAARFYLGGAEQRSADALCRDQPGRTHTVTISEGRVDVASVTARVCDKLVIINADSAQRRLAFGEHDHHVAYDGADGRLLGKDDALTLVLTETGQFIFHDHFDSGIQGSFTVR